MKNRAFGTVLLTLLTVFWCFQLSAASSDPADQVYSLIDPAKLATLGQRGANPRIQKAVYWLATARQEGQKLGKVLDQVVERAGYTNPLAAKLTKEALLRNLDIAERLGCLDAEGLDEMKHGKAATVRRGPYAAQCFVTATPVNVSDGRSFDLLAKLLAEHPEPKAEFAVDAEYCRQAVGVAAGEAEKLKPVVHRGFRKHLILLRMRIQSLSRRHGKHGRRSDKGEVV